MARKQKQFYGDLTGHPRFFDPSDCEVYSFRTEDSEIAIGRVSPGVWVRGIWEGAIDRDVPPDGPVLARRLLKWDQVTLVEAARMFPPLDLPSSLVRDIEPPPKGVVRAKPSVLVPVVTLGDGPDDPPVVRGVQKDPLPDLRYRTVRALLAAKMGGLSHDQLAKATGDGSVSRTLRLIKNLDSDWDSAILTPGKPYGRYKIAHAPLGDDQRMTNK